MLPLAFVATTTITAGVESIFRKYLPMAMGTEKKTLGIISVSVTAGLILCVLMVIVGSAARWLALLRRPSPAAETA